MFPLFCTALRIWLQLLDENKQQDSQGNLIRLISPHLLCHAVKVGEMSPPYVLKLNCNLMSDAAISSFFMFFCNI